MSYDVHQLTHIFAKIYKAYAQATSIIMNVVKNKLGDEDFTIT